MLYALYWLSTQMVNWTSVVIAWGRHTLFLFDCLISCVCEDQPYSGPTGLSYGVKTTEFLCHTLKFNFWPVYWTYYQHYALFKQHSANIVLMPPSCGSSIRCYIWINRSLVLILITTVWKSSVKALRLGSDVPSLNFIILTVMLCRHKEKCVLVQPCSHRVTH